jgi:hypothetical protein
MSSHVLDIPPDEWGLFLDELTREHRDGIVTIDVDTAEVTDRLHVQDVPLEGIVLMLEGNEEVISIIAREGTRRHTMHSIHHPLRVSYEKTGRVATRLHVEAENGETTIVTFQSMSVPDTVQAQTMADPT